jgi:short-subunit dehydrogenase
MTKFADKYGPWAVVTGAAQGVGLAFTEELIERGVGVVMVDISTRLSEVAESLPGETRSLIVDLTERGWTDELDRACAGLDVGLAVANAGVSHVGKFCDMTAEQRRLTLDVNCGATADLAAWVLPALIERGSGGFVATSSGSALAGTAGFALYSATKAFAVNLVEAIGWEHRDDGIDTLAVIAPSMDTPAFRASGAESEQMLSPAADPRVVVVGALDALGEGGRWLADDGLKFAAAVERRERVDMMSEATTAMYPHVFGP